MPSINDNLMSGGELQAALLDTDASGNTVLVGGDGTDIGMVVATTNPLTGEISFIRDGNSAFIGDGKTTAGIASTLLTDFTTGTLAYNGGAASDSTLKYSGNNTIKIPHNASGGASRMDWDHPTSWGRTGVLGFIYKNATDHVLYCDVLQATNSAFSTAETTTAAFEPTGEAWGFATLVLGVVSGSGAQADGTGFTRLRVRESINAPFSSGADFVNIAKVFSATPGRAIAMIEFDDVDRSCYLYGVPIVESYGFRGNFNVITSLVGTGIYSSWADCDSLYLKGWDITNHSHTHPYVQTAGVAPSSIVDNANNTATVTTADDHKLKTGAYVVISGFTPAKFNNGAAQITVTGARTFTYVIVSDGVSLTVTGTWNPAFSNHGLRNLNSYQEKYDDIRLGQEALLSYGYNRSAKHFTYPQGGYDLDTINACKALGTRTQRGTYEAYMPSIGRITGLNNSYGTTLTNLLTATIPPYQEGINLPGTIDIGGSWATVKAQIDKAVAYGGIVIGLIHYISGNRHTAGTYANKLELFCQYLYELQSQGKITVMTRSEYYSMRIGKRMYGA